MRTSLAAASAAVVLGSMLAASSAVNAPPPEFKETPAERNTRMAWWRSARFGMFIHFGLYSTPAGTWDGKEVGGAGEWLLNGGKIDPIAYEKTLLPQFNPVKFDAKQWADIARDAGMQYVVITTKHHDGFALWNSAVSDYDVMATPFKRDIMKELSDAVRADGLTMCWYHSIMDWHHPDYQPRRDWDKRPVDPASFPRYVDYMQAQLKELLTQYGPIGILWFDGEWEGTWNHDWGKKTDDFVRSLQPRIIVNNRVDSGRAGMEGFSADEKSRGDYGTPEQTIPPNGMPGKDWETCMTMNDTWGFKASDHHWKDAREMIRMLCDIASKGGNFLLNVGPKGDGTVPQESIDRLKRMGEWMKVNGTAIHGTEASPFPRKFQWGRITQGVGPLSGRESTTLNLLVFEWPKDGTLRLPGIGNEVLPVTAVLGAPDRKPTVARDANGIVVSNIGAAPVDADVTVVRIAIAGKPQVEPFMVKANSLGLIACTAADAVVTGSIQYEDRFQNLGWWRDTASTASWDIMVPKDGNYQVSVDYACNETCGGDFEVTIVDVDNGGSSQITQNLPPRKDWGDFKTVQVGVLPLKAGHQAVSVKAASKPGESFINLRNVTLRPVE
jgi:alpha-L-fucosidase